MMSASRTTKQFTAHPAFPMIVALWFAALLGLGTFVVPPANFEGLVVGTGLDSLIPAAAPPLGDTARLAISAIAALFGALLGLAIAARIRRVEDEPQDSEVVAPTSDSPWLADQDEVELQGLAGYATSPDTQPVDPVESDTLGAVRSRLGGRRNMSGRDDPISDEPEYLAQEETEEEAERIFQASKVHLREDVDFDIEVEGETVSEPTTPNSDSEDEDLQRFAADRLVAGLPRQRRNFDDNPLEDWSQPAPAVEEPAREPEVEVESAAMPDPDATEAHETESDGPDFDAPEPVEEAKYEELPGEPVTPAPGFEVDFEPDEPAAEREWAPAASDTPTEPSWAAEAELVAGPVTARPDFSASSLSELVARFDAALAARRSQSPAPENQLEPATPEQTEDPVIAFLRREADRENGAPGDTSRERSDDPRAVLRNALDKLDRVSRKS